jgi:hypothetical protein
VIQLAPEVCLKHREHLIVHPDLLVPKQSWARKTQAFFLAVSLDFGDIHFGLLFTLFNQQRGWYLTAASEIRTQQTLTALPLLFYRFSNMSHETPTLSLGEHMLRTSWLFQALAALPIAVILGGFAFSELFSPNMYFYDFL